MQNGTISLEVKILELDNNSKQYKNGFRIHGNNMQELCVTMKDQNFEF